ncbi:MAG: hypothetical protein E7089_04220 [Bacteroidales bacterium]|nr:hypothetical protein [Bacteroidales bacterium]
MKQLFSFFVVATLLFTVGCSKEYDDAVLSGRVDDLENRVLKLEQLCLQMNTNISSLQTIVTALHNNDYVTGVTPVSENGNVVGYTISFAKAEPITIYHGKDDKDGYTPIIGVKQDSDGIYYWTLDGEWLLDDGGNKVKAVGVDGKDDQNGANGSDGKDGADGKDGITPQLKIENDYWYVSYDNGATWTQLGKATGEYGKDGTDGKDGKDGDSFFQSVTQDENNVYFTLADGTVITLPKGLALSIAFDEADLVVMSLNSTRSIAYTVTSATESVMVEVTSSADIQAKVVAHNENGLTGKIEIRTGAMIDEYSKVIVFVSNGDKVIMRSITFEEAGLEVGENAVKNATAEGGELTLEFLSNVACEAVIPEDAQSWISVVPATRALEKQTITLKLEANEGYYRSATVTVQSLDGSLKLEYNVEQDGDLGVEIDPTAIPDNEIWYTTTDGRPISLKSEVGGWPNAEFNTSIIYNGYRNGKGVIEFDAPVTQIGRLVFAQKYNITSIYLPKTINRIGLHAFIECDNLETVSINSESLLIEEESDIRSENNPFVGCSKLSRFIGPLSSDDGRCLIVNNAIHSFAPYNITEYTTPKDVTQIMGNAFAYNNLHTIVISEGVEYIGFQAFMGKPEEEDNLEYVYLPSTLERLEGYTFLFASENIKAFYGDCKLISNDGYSLIVDNYHNLGKWIIHYAAGSGNQSYSIPEGVEGVESYCFHYVEELTEITFPSTLRDVASEESFAGSNNIERIYGANVLGDNRSLVIDGTLKYVAPKGLKEYTTPSGVTNLSYGVLSQKPELESIILSDDVLTVGDAISCRPYEIPLGYILWDNPNLKTVTISANMRILGMDPFGSGEIGGLHDSKNIETVYLRAPIPPVIGHNFSDKIPTLFPNLTIYVPEASLEAYMSSPDWAPYRGYFKGYNYTDLPDNDTYFSTDYSQDGKVVTLQTATKGNGIDIVLMGDAYSDRQIADGSYKADMENLYNNLFTEEPYKSFKDHFNVYYVNVVSAIEGYEYSGAALGGYFGSGTLAGGNDNAVFDYALKAISEEKMDEAMLIVAMNSDNYAGTCYMYYPESVSGTYGSGPSVSYFPKGGDAETFAQLLHHEACGHGFAKLADEYAYEYMGAAPSDYVSQIQAQQNSWGWWKNVDFTSDPTATRWSHFVNDTRYANEGLGAYEGGLTYWSGVWRPTENSIMRYNTGGFNAPSREAIYYRIHKLAYGDSWEYDYEKFVEWDAVNRSQSASALRKKAHKPANYKPTHPPVIVNKSWRDAK